MGIWGLLNFVHVFFTSFFTKGQTLTSPFSSSTNNKMLMSYWCYSLVMIFWGSSYVQYKKTTGCTIEKAKSTGKVHDKMIEPITPVSSSTKYLQVWTYMKISSVRHNVVDTFTYWYMLLTDLGERTLETHLWAQNLSFWCDFRWKFGHIIGWPPSEKSRIRHCKLKFL